MASADLQIDSRPVSRALKRLQKAGPRAMAEALNKTAFEILDALERHVASRLEFSGTTTRRFIARGFRFDKARQNEPEVTIFTRRGPGGRTRRILTEQALGGFIRPGEERLTFRGKLAIPINVPRSARGKVPKNMAPNALFPDGGNRGRRRTFVRGNVIVQRRGRDTKVLYVLIDQARLRDRIDFKTIVRRTAIREFPRKADRVIDKERERLRRG